MIKVKVFVDFLSETKILRAHAELEKNTEMEAKLFLESKNL